MKRQIDILLATHNGETTLPRMLEALAALAPPQRPWRIVAVDNASTDQTAHILEAWEARLPLKRLFCAEPGKAAALQLGLAYLEGDLIVVTDDDILPEPDWLVALETAADLYPQHSIFGGKITPRVIEDVQPWYPASQNYHSDLFAATTAQAGPVIGADCIFGPNMMFRRALVAGALSRRSTLGPTFLQTRGRRVFPLGDESEMIAELERAGSSSLFVTQARVGHMVRRFQTELPFMLQRAQNHGRGVALRAVARRRDATGRLQIVWSSGLRVLWLLRFVVFADRSEPAPATFDRLYGFNWHLGRLKGAMFGPFAA